MLRQSAKKYGIVLLAIVGVWFFLRHDAFLYQGPVGQVTQMTEKVTQATTDEHNNSDTMITQHLTVAVLNRHQTIKLTNTYADSQVITNRYRVGDQLLLENVGGNIHILSLKRDAWIGALATLFIGLLVIYSRWRATSWLLLSLVLNVGLFGIAIHVDIHDKNANVLLVFSVLALGLAIASLALVLGKTLQMTLTLLATVVTTGLTMLILFAVLAVTHGKGIHFETMSYVTQLPKSIFMAQTVIGVLGAVMDEAADIVAMQFGMRRENVTRQFSDYWQAGLSVGRDIMGTLVNVLFMIFIAETLPMVFLMLRNGNNWAYIMDQIMNLGILQTVVSGIGIVLAVPVTSVIVGWAMSRKAVKA